ncbi:MAG: Trm112 family protein [Aquificae bacterium]|nr:Trm112 family protein [Aquificota bacterium]
MLEKELLDILACPRCKNPLTYDKNKNILVCQKCSVYYEVKEGIPVLLPEEGKPLNEPNQSKT